MSSGSLAGESLGSGAFGSSGCGSAGREQPDPTRTCRTPRMGVDSFHQDWGLTGDWWNTALLQHLQLCLQPLENHRTTEILARRQGSETEGFGGDSGNPDRTLAARKCPRAVAMSPRRLAARASFCSSCSRTRSTGTESGSGQGSGAGGGCGGAGGCTGGSGLMGGGGPGAPPPFPRATGGGISASSIRFPFWTDSSICSRVWGKRGMGKTVKIWRNGVK